MWNIAFGLTLYNILADLLGFFVLLAFIAFVMNIFDGKGFGYNFKKVWSGLLWVFRFGTAKRT